MILNCKSIGIYIIKDSWPDIWGKNVYCGTFKLNVLFRPWRGPFNWMRAFIEICTFKVYKVK